MTEIIEANTGDEAALTIEFGGLVWIKSNRVDETEYEVEHADLGKLRIYQYPVAGGDYCCGRWLYEARLDEVLPRENRPAFLDMRVSDIVDTREEEMQFALDAKDKFIADIKTVSIQLGIGNYPTGYMDGQAALAKKIALVMP